MEFNCPACGTPHAFPDDQIPPGGIIVACTRCATHVTLGPGGVAPPTAPEPEPIPEPPAPRAPAPERRREPDPPVQSLPPMPEPPPPQPPAERSFPQPRSEPARPRLGKGDADRDVAAAPTRALGPADQPPAPQREASPGPVLPPREAGTNRWTLRDLPRAFMGPLDPTRVGFAVVGFFVALNAWALLTWLAAFLGTRVLGILGTILGIVAWVVLVGIVALVGAVIGYLSHQGIVEGRKASVKDALGWVQSNLVNVVATPLAFVAVVAVVIGVHYGVGLLGRIPFAGPIVWGLLSIVLVLSSIVAGAAAVALIYSLPLYVPVIYNERTRTPQGTLMRLLGLFKDHGFALVGYLLLSVVVITLAFSATIWLAWQIGWHLTGYIGGMAMGGNLTGIFASAPGSWTGFLATAINPLYLPGMGDAPGFGHTVGGILAGIGTSVVSALLLATWAVTFYSAGAIIYNIVTGRQKAAG